MKDEIVSSAIFVAMILLLAFAWYFVWVKPNTERMYTIMDCMTDAGDHTEHGYAMCVDRLNEAG